MMQRAGGEEERCRGEKEEKGNWAGREVKTQHMCVERERVGGEEVTEGSIARHRGVSQRHARTSLTLVSMM